MGLAVYGHGFKTEDNEKINIAYGMFIDAMIQSDCLIQRNKHVLYMYEAVKLPFRRTQRLEFILPQQCTMPQFIGLLSSVSTYRYYCEKFPENTLMRNIQSTYEKEDTKCIVEEFTFQGFLILGMND